MPTPNPSPARPVAALLDPGAPSRPRPRRMTIFEAPAGFEDPVAHDAMGCDTPAPLVWRRCTPNAGLPGAREFDLTLLVPREGGVGKAVAFYGTIPLFAGEGVSLGETERFSGRQVYRTGSMDSGMPVAMTELIAVLCTAYADSVPLKNAFVNMPVPTHSTGTCACNQQLVCPLWGACGFDVWSTCLPSGLVPTALAALDMDEPRHARLDMANNEEAEAAALLAGSSGTVYRPAVYTSKIEARAPRVFLAECCARTYLHKTMKNMTRSLLAAPATSAGSPLFTRNALQSIPVVRAPSGVATHNLAAFYTGFQPCSTPRLIGLHRHTAELLSSKMSAAAWAAMYGTNNFILMMSRSTCLPRVLPSLPTRCATVLAAASPLELVPPPPPRYGSMMATGSSAFKRPAAAMSAAPEATVAHGGAATDDEDEEEEAEEQREEEAGAGAGAGR